VCLHAPHLLDVEVTAALRRRVRLGQTRPTRAIEALTDLAALAALRWDHAPLVGSAWELQESVTAYDGVYVALAEALDAVLVTSDVRLSRTRRACAAKSKFSLTERHRIPGCPGSILTRHTMPAGDHAKVAAIPGFLRPIFA